jgi:hypothetical protein
MVIDGLSASQACNSCEREARPMDAIYNVAGLTTPRRIPKDQEKITKYNHLNRKMVDTCWECPRGPMKPCSRCKKCVRVHLNETLPINFNLD